MVFYITGLIDCQGGKGLLRYSRYGVTRQVYPPVAKNLACHWSGVLEKPYSGTFNKQAAEF